MFVMWMHSVAGFIRNCTAVSITGHLCGVFWRFWLTEKSKTYPSAV